MSRRVWRRPSAWPWVVLTLWAGLGGVAIGTPIGDRLAGGDGLYNRWSGGFEFAAYEARLREAIALWEQVLTSADLGDGERAGVLVRLSRAWFELAEAYLPDRERRDTYRRGEDAALAALRLDPEFVRVEAVQGFRASLGAAQDVEAIFWYGNNLGRFLNYDYGRALFGGTRDVLAAFTRAVELDEAYWGGGPHRALANFLAQTPGFLGGDGDRAGVHFARAVELDPVFIQNHVDWAEFSAGPRRDWDAFCRLLQTALDPGAETAAAQRWPLYTHLASGRARALALAPTCP